MLVMFVCGFLLLQNIIIYAVYEHVEGSSTFNKNVALYTFKKINKQ